MIFLCRTGGKRLREDEIRGTGVMTLTFEHGQRSLQAQSKTYVEPIWDHVSLVQIDDYMGLVGMKTGEPEDPNLKYRVLIILCRKTELHWP